MGQAEKTSVFMEKESVIRYGGKIFRWTVVKSIYGSEILKKMLGVFLGNALRQQLCEEEYHDRQYQRHGRDGIGAPEAHGHQRRNR